MYRFEGSLISSPADLRFLDGLSGPGPSLHCFDTEEVDLLDDFEVSGSAFSCFRLDCLVDFGFLVSLPSHDDSAGFDAARVSRGMTSSCLTTSSGDVESLFYFFPLNASAFCFRLESFVDMVAEVKIPNFRDRHSHSETINADERRKAPYIRAMSPLPRF
jgi:hypothetical protein